MAIIDDTKTFTINIAEPWDGNWHPETLSYDSNGIAANGEALNFLYTKTSSNPDVYQANGWSGPTSTMYEWAFYMRNKTTLQTVNMFISEASGMRPFYSTVHNGHIFKPWYTEDGVHFSKCESSYDAATNVFTYWFTPTSQYCMVSVFYPWNYTKNQSFINTFTGYDFVNISNVITSEHGRNVTMVEMTNFSIPETSKKHIFIEGRQHSVESLQAPIIAYMMNHIKNNSYLRDAFHWYFIPEINPDGCAGASTSYQWQTWNSNVNPIIVAVKNYIANNIHTPYGLDVFFDWHALGSGYGSHILHNLADTAGATLCALMRQHTANAYTCEAVDYSTAVAYSYAYHTWGCPSFTPEPSQRNWLTTNATLKSEGEGIVEAIYDYYF